MLGGIAFDKGRESRELAPIEKNLQFMLWDNGQLSKHFGNDILWNITFEKKENLKIWFDALRDFITVGDDFGPARIKFILKDAHDCGGLLGFIDKVQF